MKRLHVLVLCLIVALLPLRALAHMGMMAASNQGMAAGSVAAPASSAERSARSALPRCHDAPVVGASVDGQGDGQGQAAPGMADASDPTSGDPGTSGGSHNCSLCALCHAGFAGMAPPRVQVPALRLSERLPAATTLPSPDGSPSEIFRPPRRLA